MCANFFQLHDVIVISLFDWIFIWTCVALCLKRIPSGVLVFSSLVHSSPIIFQFNILVYVCILSIFIQRIILLKVSIFQLLILLSCCHYTGLKNGYFFQLHNLFLLNLLICYLTCLLQSLHSSCIALQFTIVLCMISK